jgi:hypothetical protein
MGARLSSPSAPARSAAGDPEGTLQRKQHGAEVELLVADDQQVGTEHADVVLKSGFQPRFEVERGRLQLVRCVIDDLPDSY